MVLDKKTSEKIKAFVKIKPRTIQEIALLLNKNWRTANSYVEKITKETGEIAYRVFRGGTPGAVKIVYWNNLDEVHSSKAQERLFKQIELSQNKEDFSPFDIYQYVDEKKKNSFLEDQTEENINVKQDLVGTLRSAQEQVLFFSGNLTWVNIKQGKIKLIDVLTELAESNISLKFIANIDITNIDNVKKLNQINNMIGRDIVEIRHCKQPLRAFIVDNKVIKMKEIKDPKDYKDSGLKKITYIFYEIKELEWVEWMQKVFWNLFRIGIPASKRIKELKTIKRIN
jgi:hypothetical protein